MKDPFTWTLDLRRRFIGDRIWFVAGFAICGVAALLDKSNWVVDLLGVLLLVAALILLYPTVRATLRMRNGPR